VEGVVEVWAFLFQREEFMPAGGKWAVRQATIGDSCGLARVQVDSYRRAYAGIFPPSYLAHFTYEEQEQDWHDLLSMVPSDNA
jgi:hypothetical protein